MKVSMCHFWMLMAGLVMLLPLGCSSQEEPADPSEDKTTKTTERDSESSSDEDDDVI